MGRACNTAAAVSAPVAKRRAARANPRSRPRHLTPDDIRTQRHAKLLERLRLDTEVLALEFAPDRDSQAHKRALKAVRATAGIMADEMAFLWTRWEDHKQGQGAYAPPYRSTVYSSELQTAGALVRSIDARMGRSLETLMVRLARERWPASRLPDKMYSMVDDPDDFLLLPPPKREAYLDGTPLPIIISTISQEAVKQHASRLLQQLDKAEIDKIGSEGFQEAFAEAVAEVSCQRQKTPWTASVDYAVRGRHGMEIIEMKLGGNFSSKNARAEVANLLRAALGYADPEARIRFAIADSGEDFEEWQRLNDYFTHDGKHPALMVDENFWNEVLPQPVRYDEMLELLERIALTYTLTLRKEQNAEHTRRRLAADAAAGKI